MLKEIKAWVLATIVCWLVRAVLLLPPSGLYAFSKIFRDELELRSIRMKQAIEEMEA